MFRPPSGLTALLMIASLGWAVGCGSNGPDTVPAGGTVTYQGQGLAGATVIFAAQEPVSGVSYLATAITDADGRFQLRTQATPTQTLPGAIPGAHRVTISKFVPPAGMSEEAWEQKFAAEKAAMEARGVVTGEETAPPKVQLLPPQYSHGQQTTLSAEVPPEGTNEFAFEL